MFRIPILLWRPKTTEKDVNICSPYKWSSSYFESEYFGIHASVLVSLPRSMIFLSDAQSMKMQPVGLWKTTELYRNSEGRGQSVYTHHDVNERKGCMKAPLSLITGPNKAVLLDVLFFAKNPKRILQSYLSSQKFRIPFFSIPRENKIEKMGKVECENHQSF